MINEPVSRQEKVDAASVSLSLAELGYAVAMAEFQRASNAENQLLSGEFSLQEFAPEHLSQLEEAMRKTAEKLEEFNKAAALFRETKSKDYVGRLFCTQ